MPTPSLTIPQLVGHWSHGVAHGYYGGSHDFSLVLLADGRGSFIHDGWCTYRFASFQWSIEAGTLVISTQRFCAFSPMGHDRRCLQIGGSVSLRFDSTQQRERLDIPLADEPSDFYLVTRDVREADLQLEHLARADRVLL